MNLGAALTYSHHAHVEKAAAKVWTMRVLLFFAFSFPILEGISNEMFPVGTKALGFLVATVWLLESLALRKVRIVGPVPLFLIYLFWNIATILWTFDYSLSISRVVGLTQALALYWIVVDVVESQKQLKQLASAYVLGVMLLGVTAVGNVLSTQSYSGLSNRFSAMGTDPNNFGVMVVSALPLTLFAETSSKKSWKWLTHPVLYTAVAIPVVLSTASRAAALGIGLVGIGYILLQLVEDPRQHLRRSALYVALLFGVSYLTIRMVPEQAISRLSGGLLIDQGGGRLNIWQLAAELGASRPLTGYGAGTFLSVSGQYLSEQAKAHNTFLSAFADLGLIGVVLWTLLWLWHGLALWRSRLHTYLGREIRLGLTLSLLGVLIGALTLNWEVRKPVYLVWGMVATYAVICQRVRKDNVAKEEGR